jgi:hypothetical protein
MAATAAGAGQADDAARVALGRAIAEKDDSRRHAVGETGDSANRRSPPLGPEPLSPLTHPGEMTSKAQQRPR